MGGLPPDEIIFGDYMSGKLNDMNALEDLIKRRTPLVMRIIRGIIAKYKKVDKATVEDLTQDTWRKVFTAKDYSPTAKFPTWLGRIARNTALDWLRKEVKNPITAFPHTGIEGDEERREDTEIGRRDIGPRDIADIMVAAHSLIIDLQDCIKDLPEKAYKILDLYFGSDWTQREIAKAVQASLGKAWNLLHLGMKKLRQCIEGKGWTADYIQTILDSDILEEIGK